LMGPDSTSRNVLELHRGSEEMVEIKPTKGDPWVVNKGHILTLVRMGRKKLSGEIRDIAVTDYLSWSAYMKREFKLFRVGGEFTAKSRLPLDPYFLGTLLGDGSDIMNRWSTSSSVLLDRCSIPASLSIMTNL